MIRIVNPQVHGFVGAMLDANGDPYKLVCDAFEVATYVLDTNMSPMASAVVTYRRVDSQRNFESGGPLTQHYITGLELADLLEASADLDGITIPGIEESTLRTGIPSAHIRPEDLAADDTLPVWRGEFMINHLRETVKRIQELEANPPPLNTFTPP